MHCTYITKHVNPATPFYYLGKSQPHLILKGYMGSGVRLHCYFMHPGFEREQWKTTIIEVFDTEAEAYDHEALLCPLELLKDPFCVNDTPGGRRMNRGSAHGRIVRSAKSKERKAALAVRKEKAKLAKAKKKEAFARKLLQKERKLTSSPGGSRRVESAPSVRSRAGGSAARA